jgi:hypothetical protein
VAGSWGLNDSANTWSLSILGSALVLVYVSDLPDTCQETLEKGPFCFQQPNQAIALTPMCQSLGPEMEPMMGQDCGYPVLGAGPASPCHRAKRGEESAGHWAPETPGVLQVPARVQPGGICQLWCSVANPGQSSEKFSQ